jgi:hypothetical protein
MSRYLFLGGCKHGQRLEIPLDRNGLPLPTVRMPLPLLPSSAQATEWDLRTELYHATRITIVGGPRLPERQYIVYATGEYDRMGFVDTWIAEALVAS